MSVDGHEIYTDNQSIEFVDGFEFTATSNASLVFAIAKEAETIVKNTYDELGQLESKEVGGGLQTIDYSYNIRGWLTGINDSNVLDNTITLGADDVWGFNLKYNNPSHSTANALYNGNISETIWSSENDNKSDFWYIYQYDDLNRITSAQFAGGGWWSRYNLSGVTYDKNSNILSLNRSGLINEDEDDFGLMDALQYTYNVGNKLEKVDDSEELNFGFVDGEDAETEYTYDIEGNMTSDSNKGITNISYNHLNLPTTVTIKGQNISYIYDASGMKLSKSVGGVTTKYAGGYIYENDELQFFPHPEGYVSPEFNSGSIAGFNYVYQYKDHLGNVRLSYTDADKNGIIDSATEIIEEKNYYPFGLQHKGYNDVVSPLGNGTAEKFGYNGKELSEEHGLNLYEMDVRSYDPTIARWTSIDPVIHYSLSTYNAFDNNPVYWADPSGANAIRPEEIKSSVANDFLGTTNRTGVTIYGMKGSHSPMTFTGGDGGNVKKENGFTQALAENGGIDALVDENDDCCGGNSKEAASTLAFGWTVALVEPTPVGEGVMTLATGIAALYYGDKVMDDLVDIIQDSASNNNSNDFYYVTYTKTNFITGEVYVGRSSGYGSPERAVKTRDYGHHKLNDLGFSPAVLSTYAKATKIGGYGARGLDYSYWKIRGSEQLQIEHYRYLGISANDRNGIGSSNPRIIDYLKAAYKGFKR